MAVSSVLEVSERLISDFYVDEHDELINFAFKWKQLLIMEHDDPHWVRLTVSTEDKLVRHRAYSHNIAAAILPVQPALPVEL